MARNKDRYVYIELAVLRESPLLQQLLADAAASGKPPAQVAVQRLADYYRAGSLPGASHPAPEPRSSHPTAPLSASPAFSQEASDPNTGENTAPDPAYQAEQARLNALAALDALDF